MVRVPEFARNVDWTVATAQQYEYRAAPRIKCCLEQRVVKFGVNLVPRRMNMDGVGKFYEVDFGFRSGMMKGTFERFFLARPVRREIVLEALTPNCIDKSAKATTAVSALN